MSSVFNHFLAGKTAKYRATIIYKEKTLSHGRIVEVEPSEDEDKVFDCYFWRQGMGRINIGQTFKTDVTAYIITSPDWISVSDFTKDCRLKIEQQTDGTYNEIAEFDFIYAEDVGGLGYVIQVALKQVI
jgi:hypothetical protein